MNIAEFLLGRSFHYTGNFHRLKSFADMSGVIIPDRAIELRRSEDGNSLINVNTGEEWQIVGVPVAYFGRKNGQPLPELPAIKIFRPEFGNILLLLKDCTLIKN